MSNILYIHGFKSNSNSSTFRNLREIFPEQAWFSADFDLTDIKGTEEKIKALIKEYKINILVASSLGAFYALLNSENHPCIVINPCMRPSIEIPKLDSSVKEETLKKWANLEKGHEEYVSFGALAVNMNEMRCNAFGIFGNHDELFSYKELFEKIYGAESAELKKTFLVEGGHHSLSKDVLKKYFSKAFEYFKLNQEYFSLAKDLFPPMDQKEEEEYFASKGSSRKEFYEKLEAYKEKAKKYQQD
ncbi:MAG: hypothetical protein K5866_04795 [Treponema sp.]|nr:hypothetical protein [Treponema sp.]